MTARHWFCERARVQYRPEEWDRVAVEDGLWYESPLDREARLRAAETERQQLFWIWRETERMPEAARVLLTLVCFRGLSQRQTAAILGWHRSTVSARLNKVIAVLRAKAQRMQRGEVLT